MPDYSKSQIYKITDIGQTKCYIGSSIQPLSVRMAGHRRRYNYYLVGKLHYYPSVFYLFDEFGIDNCKILWLKNYPCSSKKELEAEEGRIQQETECVNKRIEGRTPHQWREDNKEYLDIKRKEYCENNKDREKARKSNWYYNNKSHCSNVCRNNYEKNREERLKQSKATYENKKTERYECQCGSVVACIRKKAHEKTLKHQQYLQSQNNPQE